MKSGRLPSRLCTAALLAVCSGALAAGEYTFDATEFEKKPTEFGGYVQLRREALSLRPDSAFYRLNNYGRPLRTDLERTTATLELAGKLRLGEGTLDVRTHSTRQQDAYVREDDHTLYEAAYSYRLNPGLSLDAGKRVMRWGKGYAWNPVGFIERPKDPNDPELAREGYWLASADYIINRDGPLQTIAITPVLVPVGGEVNGDFGTKDHLNPAAKLYLLYRDTDIDLMWQAKGSRPGRYGFDVSRNISSNLEVHGEWARISDATKRIASSLGTTTTRTGDATSYLLGVRYLTEGNATWIAEYYRNGTGYSDQQARDFYQFVDYSFAQLAATGSDALVQRARTLSAGSYGRPNTGTRYAYLRVQQKDAWGVVYLQPSLTLMRNLDDGSMQVTPEVLYTGFSNVELRARLYLLNGDRMTDFGAKQNGRRIELQARLYF